MVVSAHGESVWLTVSSLLGSLWGKACLPRARLRCTQLRHELLQDSLYFVRLVRACYSAQVVASSSDLQPLNHIDSNSSAECRIVDVMNNPAKWRRVASAPHGNRPADPFTQLGHALRHDVA
jgi:hypothetical protein